MSSSKPTTQSSTKMPKAQDVEAYSDEPVPSYETALREGAGGGVAGVGSGSSSSAAAAGSAPLLSQTQQPHYGCSPYSSHGTARIVILPAANFHAHPDHDLLPLPASAQPRGPRARPRFFLALMHALLIYILINILVNFIATRHW